MTVIAAVVHDGQVYMGADSLISHGDGSVSEGKAGKIWVADNGMLIGTAGTQRGGQVMRYAFTAPAVSEGQDLVTYLVKAFVPDLRDAHRDAGTLTRRDGVEWTDVWALIGWRGRLFSVGCDFSVTETPEDCAAEGSGTQIALAVLHATRDLPPRDRLARALEAAERFAFGVRRPFTYLPELEKEAEIK